MSLRFVFAAMTLGGTVDVLATDDPDAIAEEHEELQIYEKHNNLLHGSKRKKCVFAVSQLSNVLFFFFLNHRWRACHSVTQG